MTMHEIETWAAVADLDGAGASPLPVEMIVERAIEAERERVTPAWLAVQREWRRERRELLARIARLEAGTR